MENRTGNQLLRDPGVRPTDGIIAEGLGGADKAFVKFKRGLEQYGVTLMEWRYYNDGKAWLSKGEYKWITPRGASKAKPLFWLSVWEGFFKVSFFFPESAKDGLLSLPVSGKAKELVRSAKPMGKTMRFMPVVIDVKDDGILSDIYEFARFKKEQ